MGVVGEALSGWGHALEACGDLSCVGGPWRGLMETRESGGGLQTKRRPTRGLEHRRWDLRARSCSWRLSRAQTIVGATFYGWSSDPSSELAGEEGVDGGFDSGRQAAESYSKGRKSKLGGKLD